MLEGLDEKIPPDAAMRLSRDLFLETAHLRKAFDPVWEPHLNNFLINTGIKKKGLCYQWSDALYLAMTQKHYNGFDFHAAGANIGRYWSEHNVLVITAKGHPFGSGIVIDAWRDPGRLYFAKVTEDRQYAWKERKDRLPIEADTLCR